MTAAAATAAAAAATAAAAAAAAGSGLGGRQLLAGLGAACVVFAVANLVTGLWVRRRYPTAADVPRVLRGFRGVVRFPALVFVGAGAQCVVGVVLIVVAATHGGAGDGR